MEVPKRQGLKNAEENSLASVEHIPDHPYAKALRKIATADAASSRAAIQASKATKPSLHTRFVHDPAEDHA